MNYNYIFMKTFLNFTFHGIYSIASQGFSCSALLEFFLSIKSSLSTNSCLVSRIVK